MIPHRNCEVFASVIFFLVIKIFCSLVLWYRGMYKKQPTLTSIPERNETEDEQVINKWVPKKKHEVLKAKYKCLKKLFQIYDASVIGILPESYAPDGYLDDADDAKSTGKRKKRSHRTKTDACAGTREPSSGDVSIHSDEEKESIATAVIRDLKIKKCLSTSTQMESQVSAKESQMLTKEYEVSAKEYKYAATQDSRENLILERNISADGDRHECEFTQTSNPHALPYFLVNERKPRIKPTRFQCFLQRIFGIRREKPYKNYVLPSGHIYAASDNNISDSYCDKRRRKGLRFRRLRRPKKIQSEIALRELNSPVILSYVQSVQRSCLADTTPRHCPILGCLMISYGIINYNDHLNLCHFPERKFVCHYCHEGFESKYDKFVHENEHIGISKLEGTANMSVPSTRRTACNTQTEPESKSEVPEDKLKKIVSFFDKISDPEQIFTEIKKNRYSECNLQRSKTEIETEADSSDSSDKRTVSCVNLPRKIEKNGGCSSIESDMTTGLTQYGSPIICHICGENFSYKRQLSLHVDLEHRVHDKFTKFHSCAGLLNHRSQNHVDMVSEDGKIAVQSIDRSRSMMRRSPSSMSQETYSDLSRRRSEESLSCDPSTNIVYYTSLETVKKPSMVNNIVQKVRSGLSYKWEPGTKIIRV